MWFYYCLIALFFLLIRRTAEKNISNTIPSYDLAWLQQISGVPVMIVILFFSHFFWPTDLSLHFWLLITLYGLGGAIDLYLYFKSISVADISYVASLMTLVSIGNVLGAYLILGQKPSLFGIIGVCLITFGVYVTHRSKAKSSTIKNKKALMLALRLILTLVVLRGFYSNLEVNLLRESNPATFNLYSSLLMAFFAFMIAQIIKKYTRLSEKITKKSSFSRNQLLAILFFIGATYTANMMFTYNAKLEAPNAGYVGAIKNTQVVPMVLIGVLFFKEKVKKMQWLGVFIILAGIGFIYLSK